MALTVCCLHSHVDEMAWTIYSFGSLGHGLLSTARFGSHWLGDYSIRASMIARACHVFSRASHMFSSMSFGSLCKIGIAQCFPGLVICFPGLVICLPACPSDPWQNWYRQHWTWTSVDGVLPWPSSPKFASLNLLFFLLYIFYLVFLHPSYFRPFSAIRSHF